MKQEQGRVLFSIAVFVQLDDFLAPFQSGIELA